MEKIKFKKILVPYDNSEEFNSTLKVAEKISKNSGAIITIIHVVNQMVVAGNEYVRACTMPMSESDLFMKEKKNEIETIVERRIKKGVTVKIEVGTFNTKIIEICKKNKFDLIVLPDFQKTPFDRLVADINPLLIMEKTKVPVISVNKYIANFQIKKIMLPVRNVVNWFKKVPYVVEIAKITGAKIFVLGVANTSNNLVINKLEQKLKICSLYLKKHNVHYDVNSIYGHGDPSYDVMMESSYKNIDLIAVSSPAEFLKIKTLFNSNFYNKLITNGNIPVLGMS